MLNSEKLMRELREFVVGIQESVKVTVLASTPIIKQPGTLPFRVVLVQKGSEFVVWNQGYINYEEGEILTVKGEPHYSNGNYYGPDQLPEALAKFAERVARFAEQTETIYRTLEVK